MPPWALSDPIVTAGEEEEYEVESILRHHWQWGRVMEYLVHWHGYDEAKDSQVSEQDLIHT